MSKELHADLTPDQLASLNDRRRKKQTDEKDHVPVPLPPVDGSGLSPESTKALKSLQMKNPPLSDVVSALRWSLNMDRGSYGALRKRIKGLKIDRTALAMYLEQRVESGEKIPVSLHKEILEVQDQCQIQIRRSIRTAFEVNLAEEGNAWETLR